MKPTVIDHIGIAVKNIDESPQALGKPLLASNVREWKKLLSRR